MLVQSNSSNQSTVDILLMASKALTELRCSFSDNNNEQSLTAEGVTAVLDDLRSLQSHHSDISSSIITAMSDMSLMGATDHNNIDNGRDEALELEYNKALEEEIIGITSGDTPQNGGKSTTNNNTLTKSDANQSSIEELMNLPEAPKGALPSIRVDTITSNTVGRQDIESQQL